MIINFIDCTESNHNDMDKVITYLNDYFNSLNIQTVRLKYSEMQIVKCSQCRACTQKKGEYPIDCVIKDDMNKTLKQIEEADAYVILADRNNLFTKNKVHEKISERFVAYHYWPFGQRNSTPRKQTLEKSSILINYNTTQYFMNHSFYTSRLYMEQTSHSIGAKVLDWLAFTPKEDLILSYEDRLIQMADKLIESFKHKAS